MTADPELTYADRGLPDPLELTNVPTILPLGSSARGPRRPRVHNARLQGDRAHVEVPAKTARQRKNRAQRQARKANR